MPNSRWRSDPSKSIKKSLQKIKYDKIKGEVIGENPLSFMLETQELGEHFYSPKIAQKINK